MHFVSANNRLAVWQFLALSWAGLASANAAPKKFSPEFRLAVAGIIVGTLVLVACCLTLFFLAMHSMKKRAKEKSLHAEQNEQFAHLAHFSLQLFRIPAPLQFPHNITHIDAAHVRTAVV